jgi:hypothetical protein
VVNIHIFRRPARSAYRWKRLGGVLYRFDVACGGFKVEIDSGRGEPLVVRMKKLED